MTFENIKIRTFLFLSRKIPADLKKQFKSELITEYTLRGLDKKKDLFYMGMMSRIYDLYTSSIFAFGCKNTVSLSCLLRAQLENVALILYLIENPNKIDKVFVKDEFKESQKQLNKISPDLAKYYGSLTQRSHPFHEGLKTSFGDIEQLGPKPETSNEFKPELLSKLNTKEFLDRFERIPSISCDAVPHNSIKDEDMPIAGQNVFNFYKIAKTYLDKLYELLPDTKVNDYKEMWKKHNKNKNL